jgi:N-acetylmuramic acid 6-phosphate etherase
VESRTPAREVLLDDLPTEASDPSTADLDLRSTSELVRLMNTTDATVPTAVGSALDSIAAAIDAIAARLEYGGRLVYVGAGTSGRLALVDAVECETTFAVRRGIVIAVIAGGAEATAAAQEHAEDDADAGRAQLRTLGITANDAVVAVSASGRTPFALGALTEAGTAGALTIALTSVADSDLGRAAEHEIAVIVGPEVVAGSTRLKAGTAQKLVLNMISTIVMVRLGKTFGNLMVDVVATNDKLRARVHRIVRLATGVGDDAASAALASADGDAKVAIVSLLAAVSPEEARARLEQTNGVVRQALST